MDLKIRYLEKTDWEVYRDLSLEFFKFEPLATGNSYEEWVGLKDEDWIKDFTDLLEHESAIILVAAVENNPVGIIMGTRDPRKKMNHVGLISRFYVKKEFRGKGVGKMLFKSIVDELSSKGVAKLNLDVTTTQEPAIKLYKSFGFVRIGFFKKEYLINGKFYDIYEMEKYL